TQVTVGALSTASLIYNDANELLSESYSSGTLNGLAVTNIFDAFLRRTTNGLVSGSTWLTQTRYGYDTASRLSTVASGTNTVKYSYLANSPLVGQVFFTNGSALRMTTTKKYDYLNRLTSISSAPSGSSAISFDYTYNTANQRTRRREADGSLWIYEYDS